MYYKGVVKPSLQAILMKVLANAYHDHMVNKKVMVDRRAAPMVQIILVMIWAVLPPTGEEYGLHGTGSVTPSRQATSR